MSAQSRSRKMLILLALLFLAPLAFSFWLYYGSSWRPGGSTNHGALIQPARPLPATPLAPLDGSQTRPVLNAGKWSLVYVGNGQCDADCRKTLVFTRQVYLSMGRLSDRIQRVFLVTDECCEQQWLAAEQAGLITIPAPDTQIVALFPAADRARQVFVVDPLGNLMMSYDSRAEPKGLRDDLKKLLNLSHIG